MDEALVQQITDEVAANFKCRGAGAKPIIGNPFSSSSSRKAPEFFGGVDVESVVRFVLERAAVPTP